MMQKPQEKTLEQKIKECRQVIVQNMEKSLQHKMVYLYFKDSKLDNKIKNFSINTKDGFIKVEFNDAEGARNFYENNNFKEKILIRPFNIYYNLQLNDNEMKKYFIEGITEENQRQVFEAALKVGPCKLYTNYNNPSNNARKLKPRGIISFIRKDDLTEEQYASLEAELKKNADVKISPYIAEKGLKCSITIYNFFTGDTSGEDKDIMTKAETEVRNLIKPIAKDQTTGISINVKRREDKQNKDAQKVFVTALLEFADNDVTMDNFELLRKEFVTKGETKAVLFFHNHENNSFFSLYTSGLEKKDTDSSDKVFENLLLQTYRKVNPDVLQVNIYPVKFNNSYVGRVYLKSEQAGKNFIVDYTNKRDDLIKVYKDSNHINFNINVDTKTLRKIKNAEKKASEIARNIKNYEQNQKKSRKNNPAMNQLPLGNMGGMGGFGNMGPIGIGMGAHGMMGNQGPNKMGPPMMNMPPTMGGQMNNPMMGNIMPQMGVPPMGGEIDPKKKLDQMIRDKQKFMKMQPNTSKRLIMPSLKFVLQKAGIPAAEVGMQAEKILKQDLNQVFKCLENEDQLKKKIGK